MNKLLLLTLVLTIAYPLSSQVPTVSFANWQSNRKAAYVIIHDDFGDVSTVGIGNYADTMAFNRGIKICFGAITSSCDDTDWAIARRMIGHGHECVNHSHSHHCAVPVTWCPSRVYSAADFATELGTSTQLIRTGTNEQPRFFIHPYDLSTDEVINYLKGLGYLGTRAGTQESLNTPNFADPFRLNYHVYRPENASLTTLNTAIDAAIASGGFVLREVHGVADNSWAALTLSIYRNHLDYVKSKILTGDIWSATISEVLTYKMQREAYQPVVAYTASSGIINVTFNSIKTIDPSVLKTPLTVNVNLNGLSGTFAVFQNGSEVAATRNGTIISFNVYPHQGSIELRCTGGCNQPPPTGGNCLKASYFANTSLSGTPVLVRGESAINYNWGTASPAASVPADNFSVRWETTINVPTTGRYTFSVTSDDGVRLWVNNRRIINAWNDRSATTNNASISLTQGQNIPVVLEYYERTGSASVRLAWTAPAQSSQVMRFNPCTITVDTPPPPPVNCIANGKLTRHTWTNVPLSLWNMSSLYNDPRYPNSPTAVDEITTPAASDRGDFYGERVFGYIIPPTTGTYTFTITGDDDVELFLSSNDNPATKSKIAGFQGFTGVTEYTKYTGQKSAAINLTAGRAYYIEMTHLGTVGTNHFSLYWQTPTDATIAAVPTQVISTQKCSTIVAPIAAKREIQLDGRIEFNQGIINWVVQSDDLTDFYELEKADESGHFKTLTIVNGNSSDALRAFSYTDEKLLDGENHYRIKTVAFDGTPQLSKVVTLRFARADAYMLFPNPAEGDVFIDVSAAEGKPVDVIILNTLGKVVKQQHIETATKTPQLLNTIGLESGQYFVRLQVQGRRVEMRKLFLVR